MSRSEYPLCLLKGHLYIQVEGELWLIDTGAPGSFGTPGHVELDDKQFEVPLELENLSASSLCDFVGVECAGLLGMEILGQFDIGFELPGNKLIVSRDELSFNGAGERLMEIHGLPIAQVRVGGSMHSMFFDTGAQFSYLNHAKVETYPHLGRVEDFHPEIGMFWADMFLIPCKFGTLEFKMNVGRPPDRIRQVLEACGVPGVFGNEALRQRAWWYSSRRGVLVS